jgi:hypothetical protein
MHHQAQAQFGGALPGARQAGRERLHHFAADVLVEEREDRGRDAVQADPFALAVLQGAVEGLDVVAVDVVEQLALAFVRMLQQPLSRDGAVADILRYGDTDQAELRRHSAPESC